MKLQLHIAVIDIMVGAREEIEMSLADEY